MKTSEIVLIVYMALVAVLVLADGFQLAIVPEYILRLLIIGVSGMQLYSINKVYRDRK